MNNAPIGIFDSGLGGLSVWRAVKEALPAESLIYFGDGLNCPYGGRTREEIIALTTAALEWLVGQGVKMAVVACNTATAAAIDTVRARFADIPIVGMLPAVKPAAAATKTGVMAVLATDSSVHGDVLRRYIDQFARGVEVIPAVGEGFVELVEQGREGSPEALEAVREVVEPLIARGADTLVLGCTHYPFLAETIREVIGGREVEIVDPSEAIARRVVQLLDEHGLAAEKGHKAEYTFHTFGGEEYKAKIERLAR
jgi:glutamate racemase